ncbi:MAG: 50S ribosome-binding GTPase [Fuerstiella sp.]|nr:50S ribosome-binding GTPase [Fuerstiella sp.]
MAIDAAFCAASNIRASTAPIDRVLFGSWRGEDVVVVRTGETEWEVHCHGGEAAVSRILEEFPENDSGMVALPSTLEQLLLQTRTTKTACLVLAQASGILRSAMIAAVQARTPDAFRQQLNDLLRWESVANHLVDPWRVVIAGPPNVGKSSLLNAVSGYERAIVFDQPGTTRDAVHTELVLNGWPFCVVDTAGIQRHTDDPIEAHGIARAQDRLTAADLILIAVDSSAGWTSDHDDIVLQIPDDCQRAIVYCRNDLPMSGQTPPEELTLLSTSADQGDGIRALTEWIPMKLIPDEPTLKTALPVAGTAEICHMNLNLLSQGESLNLLQDRMSQWLSSQTW